MNLVQSLLPHFEQRLLHGLKLIEQVMKVLECVVESLIRQSVELNEMQCGFIQDMALLMQ